jgi:hypothetical protein
MLSLISLIYIYPQDKDSTDDNISSWIYSYLNLDEFGHRFNGNPTISLNYGLSKIGIENFNESFRNPALFELKLGSTSENQKSSHHIHKGEKNTGQENIIDYDFDYLFASNISVNLSQNSSGGTALKSDLWRIGYGKATGYGYNLGSAAIILYYGYSLEWSSLRMIDTALNVNDKNITDLYNKTIRFGTSTEGGIKFQLLNDISLDAGYQRSIIFPRHIFWPSVGSVLIEVSAYYILDDCFINKIFRSSPYAAPVVNFVLKNALSYGIYQLRRNEMNWPFKTAAPLAYDQFKFGITFIL